MEKVWVIPDPDDETEIRTRPVAAEESAPAEKNPATAYSLSMFFWGAGQIYGRARGKGALFLALMALVVSGSFLAVFFGNALTSFLAGHGVSRAAQFLFVETALLAVLIFWTSNAGNAYHLVNNNRATPFTGAASRILPLLCSILAPGWGQFLNGQPFKGSIFAGFSVIGFFTLVTLPLAFLIWPSLEATDSRIVLELIFASTAVIAPFVPLLWLFSAYDALKISLDGYRKEPLWERIKAANNRRRVHGFVRGVVPQIKGTFFLGLFLTFLVIIGYRYFPSRFYQDALASARTLLQNRGMTLVPEFIGRMQTLLAAAGR